MNKAAFILILFVTLCVRADNAFCYMANISPEKADVIQIKPGEKAIALTTLDVKADYEILSIITARVGSTDIDSLTKMLIKKGEALGADYIIGVRYISHAGSLYAYGTAVKVKSKEAKE